MNRRPVVVHRDSCFGSCSLAPIRDSRFVNAYFIRSFVCGGGLGPVKERNETICPDYTFVVSLYHFLAVRPYVATLLGKIKRVRRRRRDSCLLLGLF